MFNILVITDNKLSSLNQCNSVVNELKRISNKKIAVEYIEVYLGLLAYLPNFLIYFFLKIRYLFEPTKKLDFIISCGRVSAPLNLVLKKKSSAKNCHILNPYFKKDEFDKIIMPEHDIRNTVEKNVITTFGSLVDLKVFKKKNQKVCKSLANKKKKYHFLLEEMVKVQKLCSTSLITQLKN